MPKIIRQFLRWYDQYSDFNTVFAAFLFSIQLVHLVWLTTNVVLPGILEIAPLIAHRLFSAIVAVVDYTEIPALLATSLIYIRSFRQKTNRKDILYLVLLNLQWLHIFWITDEVVVEIFASEGLITTWNPILAWVAIFIDYLEIPVIIETLIRASKVLARSR